METKNRIIGLDLARAVAIIGMIITHVAELTWVGKTLSSGIASSLFAVVAGMTMVVISDKPGKTTYLRLITRGLLVLLIGVALVSFAHKIQIILIIMGASMALLFWVPKIRLQYQVMLLIALMLAAATEHSLVDIYSPYSMLGWLAYMVAGMILFQVLRNNKSRLIWGIGGAIVAAIGLYVRLNVETPLFFSAVGHTGGLGNILLSLGASTAFVALCLFLGENVNAKILKPLTTFGAMSLTMYVAHVASAEYVIKHIVETSNVFVLISIIVGIVFAVVWAKFFKRGPIESIVRYLIQLIVPSPSKFPADSVSASSTTDEVKQTAAK